MGFVEDRYVTAGNFCDGQSSRKKRCGPKGSILGLKSSGPFLGEKEHPWTRQWARAITASGVEDDAFGEGPRDLTFLLVKEELARRLGPSQSFESGEGASRHLEMVLR